MSKKKPAASTLLKTANAEIVELRAQVDKLTKDRDSEKRSRDIFYQETKKLELEIEQVNMLLDVLPGAAPREKENEGLYSKKSYSLMTRLASYLAAR